MHMIWKWFVPSDFSFLCMGSRFTNTKLFNYCVSPRVVWVNNERHVVPCGKCDGCLLHKANAWSMRLKNEIDYSLVTLWCTLTYNNHYLPTLKFYPISEDGNYGFYLSDHPDNIRWNGVRDVRRTDGIRIGHDYICDGSYTVFAPRVDYQPQNFISRSLHVSYVSKRDFQLFLKILRQTVHLNFPDYDYHQIRYFAISEYGPEHLRNHIHCLFFFKDYRIASFCKESAVYESWKMCDKALFDKHTRFADSGVSGYVTNYVTGFSDLPEFFKDKDLQPFRLASKGSAIGSDSFDKKEFFDKIICGDLTYVKRVERLGLESVCQYPKNFILSVFPKCFRFSKLPFRRLLEIYGFLFTSLGRKGVEYRSVSRRLSAFKHPQDAYSALKCYKICNEFGLVPFHYVFLLDLLYYRLAMQSLSYQYSYQITHTLKQCLFLYENLSELLKNYLAFHDPTLEKTLSFFLQGFGFRISDITSSFIGWIDRCIEDHKLEYINELAEIKKDCIKMPKFNEQFGFSPHII